MKFPNFAYPWLFLLIIPAILAAYWYLRKKQPVLRFPDLSGVLRINRHLRVLSLKTILPFTCLCAALLLIILALARPREGLEEIRRRTDGVDIILALDVSGSMGAIDIPNGIETRAQLERALSSRTADLRLNVAKKEIIRFINARPADRIGLIAFAPLPYMACPPTLDHAWLISNLDHLKPGVIGDQTGIAGPVASAIRRLKDSDAKRKIIVLFTDGANNISARVTPRQAARLAKTFDITIYTVGIGSGNAVYPQTTPMGTQLLPVQGGFDEPLLREMASLTDGRYYHADDMDSMAAAMKEIDSLEKTTFEQQTLVNWRELSFPLITAAVVLLLLAFAMKNTIWLRVP